MTGIDRGPVTSWSADKEAKPKLDFVVIEMASPKASVGVRGDKIILASLETTNKKVPKDTVLISWTTDVAVKADELASNEWDVNLKSEVLWKDTMKRVRLDMLIKDFCPTVGEIWKYTPFPAAPRRAMASCARPRARMASTR